MYDAQETKKDCFLASSPFVRRISAKSIFLSLLSTIMEIHSAAGYIISCPKLYWHLPNGRSWRLIIRPFVASSFCRSSKLEFPLPTNCQKIGFCHMIFHWCWPSTRSTEWWTIKWPLASNESQAADRSVHFAPAVYL